METLIDEKQQMKAVEDYLTYTRNAFYIGRVDYYVSMEAAKLKISYIQAEGFAAVN